MTADVIAGASSDASNDASAAPMAPANLLVDLLTEDVILRMCLYLPGRALMDLGAASRSLQPHADVSPTLWRSLCVSLLGEALVQLHQEAWAESTVAQAPPGGTNSAAFMKALFRAAYECRGFKYSPEVRRRCVPESDDSIFPSQASTSRPHELGTSSSTPEIAEGIATAMSGEEPDVVLRDARRLNLALASSGPASCTVGRLVVLTGGTRQHDRSRDLHVCVVDIARGAVIKPRLTGDSERPVRRTRHAACVVAPANRTCRSAGEVAHRLPDAAAAARLLLLGGCNDQTGEPVAGLNELLFLEFPGTDCSQIRWTHEMAEGDGPLAIWHHVCGSFSQGRKVVVFGGDFPSSDPEFEYIRNREAAGHIYILDLEARRWQRVSTSGQIPCWRSLHKGVTYTSLADGSERLVIMGGSVEHVKLHGQGTLASMVGYSLNLTKFCWEKGPGYRPTWADLPYPNLNLLMRPTNAAPVAASPNTGSTSGAAEAAQATEAAPAAEEAAAEAPAAPESAQEERGPGEEAQPAEATESHKSSAAAAFQVQGSRPLSQYLPEPRMRFAADRYGRFLLVYGGHGEHSRIDPREALLKLNLVTLEWSRVETRNEPHSHKTVAGSSIASGVMAGGFDYNFRSGVHLVPKLDFICLCPPGETPAPEREEDEDAGGSNDDGLDGWQAGQMVRVHLRAPDGSNRIAVLPLGLAAAMMQSGAGQLRPAAHGRDDDADSDEEDEPGAE
eukprot:gnl/TRDRNA2_/TRDRNA2_196888_c0_seq1.p1 gnl/TRDRNA2_/TRDRNA2_196888_c0~~gnl/TRDRNA2_/TRDRNA2_196888_c0_seq1.p1  ORF type:complete len:730 (+),score=115.37 gnl/TRDRNA2_/TRDRNA2_196888_c0_seq1:45-2234(+)